jgi:uncharacterized protein (TIGR03067 family)
VALVDRTVQAAAPATVRAAAAGGEIPTRAADLERKVRTAMHIANLKWFVVAAGVSALVSAKLVALLPGVIAAAADTVEAEQKKLQGTWVALAVTESGQEQQVTGAHRMKYEGDVIALMEGDEVHASGTFKLDSSRNPMQIDIAFDSGKMSGKTGRAIYAWDGANLKFCGAIEPHDRPTDFTSTPGDGRLLLVLKRQ